MKKNFTLFLLILITGLSELSSQTALPYYTGFDNSGQQAGWTQYIKGITPSSQNLQWVYVSLFNPMSSPTCIAHYYPQNSAAQSISKNWFVSPAFNFSSGGRIDSLRAYFYGQHTPLNSDTVALYLLEGSQDPGLATSKTLLFDFRGASYVNSTTWKKFTNISIPVTPGKSYFAFYYRTDTTWLNVFFDNLTLSANPPVTSFSISSTAVCEGDQVKFFDLSAGGATAWNWTFSGASPAVSAAGNPTVTFTSAGIQTVTLISSNGAGAGNTATTSILVSSCTFLSEDPGREIDLHIFPNPTGGTFRLTSQGSGKFDYTVYTILGKEIFSGKLNGNGCETTCLEDQPAGIYFLTVKAGHIYKTYKIIKE